MVITPAAGGKALQLQMGVHIGQIPPAPLDMPAVVEDGEAGPDPVDGFPHLFRIIFIDPLAQLCRGGIVQGILPLLQEGAGAILAVASAHPYDVQEDAVRIVISHHLLNLGQQVVQVGRVEAEEMVMGRGEVRKQERPLLPAHQQPLRMAQGHLLIESG